VNSKFAMNSHEHKPQQSQVDFSAESRKAYRDYRLQTEHCLHQWAGDMNPAPSGDATRKSPSLQSDATISMHVSLLQ
jgi:hypothetical protein